MNENRIYEGKKYEEFSDYDKVMIDLEEIQEFAGSLGGKLSDHQNIKIAYRYARTIKRIRKEILDMWMRLET